MDRTTACSEQTSPIWIRSGASTCCDLRNAADTACSAEIHRYAKRSRYSPASPLAMGLRLCQVTCSSETPQCKRFPLGPPAPPLRVSCPTCHISSKISQFLMRSEFSVWITVMVLRFWYHYLLAAKKLDILNFQELWCFVVFSWVATLYQFIRATTLFSNSTLWRW